MVYHAGLATLCHEHHIPLIVDEAHGGHFAFAEQFPQVLACVVSFTGAIYPVFPFASCNGRHY